MASEASNKPTTFRAQDVEWQTFVLGLNDGAQARFMELFAAGRVKDYIVSAGRISAEVLPG